MRRLCAMIAALALICGTLIGCAGKEKEQFSGGIAGLAEIADENGMMTLPKGLEWGMSPEAVADMYGLELSEKEWDITYLPQEKNEVRGMIQYMSLRDSFVDLLEHKAILQYFFGQDRLHGCRYVISFDMENAQEALDFAKKLEEEADALFGEPIGEKSIDKDYKELKTLWVYRDGYSTWSAHDDSGAARVLTLSIVADDEGLSDLEIRDRIFYRRPADVYIILAIAMRPVPAPKSE